ncbi:hypothetical protein DQ241_14225 [Blastococcus sp. TF02A-30]|nr:hypothetical protein DQ241_14225 [Blastococcus sp. TF02A-30]
MLLDGYEGRFLPAGILLTDALTRLSPLDPVPFAAVNLLFQTAAALAVWRLLRLLLGARPVALLPLVVYLFAPLALPASSAWASAVTTVPLVAGLAWVCGDAVQLVRTGRARHAVSGTLVLALTFAFAEKALVIPVVALATAAVVQRQDGAPRPLLAALRSGRWLWAAGAAVVGTWWWFWSAAMGPLLVEPERSGLVSTAVEAVRLRLVDGVLTTLVGGPLFWLERGPWVDPPTVLVTVAAVALAAAVGGSAWRRQGTGVIWWLLAGYVVGGALLMVSTRLTSTAPAGLALGLRDYPETTLVVAVGLALVLRAPPRTGLRRLLTSTERRDAAVVVTALFVGLSTWSTVAYDRAWDTDGTAEYLDTARASLAGYGRPILDAPVPSDVVWGPAAPYNRISRVFAATGVAVTKVTDDLAVLDDTGRLVPGRVTDVRVLPAGPVPGCGHIAEGGRPVTIPVAPDIMAGAWTVQLNYLASQDGMLEVSFDQGEPLPVPVRSGAHTVYASLVGGGGSLQVIGTTQQLSVCIDSGVVGLVEIDG